MTSRANGYPVIEVIAPLTTALDNLAYRVELLTARHGWREVPR